MGPTILKQNSGALRSSKARSVSVGFLVHSRINDVKSQINDTCLTWPSAKIVHLPLETPLLVTPLVHHHHEKLIK